MRTHKLMKMLLIFALVGLTVSAFMPVASAQTKAPVQVSAKITAQGDQELKPLQNSIVLKGEMTFTGDAGTSRSTLTGVTVTYTKISAPAWATVVISPPTDVITFDGTPGASPTVSGTKSFDVIITASDQAPAFQDGEIVIEVKTAETQAFATGSAKPTATVKASYFSIIDVVLPETIKVERPQTPVIFPIKVTNFGNGPTKVQFEVIQKPENDKFQVLAPPPLQLEAAQTGGTATSKDVNLQIQTPYKNGYMNEPGTVVLKITSAYANDGSLVGDSNTVSVLVTTRGFYVPGPSPILLVGLVAAAAIVVRLVRRS